MSSLDSWIDKSELEKLTLALVSPKKDSVSEAPAPEPPVQATPDDSSESPGLPAPAEPTRKKSIILRPGPDGKLFRPKARSHPGNTEVTPRSEPPRPISEVKVEAASSPEAPANAPSKADRTTPFETIDDETVSVPGPPARARIASEALAAARHRADENGLIRRSDAPLTPLDSTPPQSADLPKPEPVPLPEFPNFASFTLPQRLAVFAEWATETSGAEDLSISDIDGYTLYPPPTSHPTARREPGAPSTAAAASRLTELLQNAGIVHLPAPDGRWNCTLHATSAVGGLNVSMTVAEKLSGDLVKRVRTCLLNALAG